MVINAEERRNAMFYREIPSPVGNLVLDSDGTFLTGLRIDTAPSAGAVCREDLEVFRQTLSWLEGYFTGDPGSVPQPPLKAEGTPFQQLVWEYLLTVPWGKTCSYGQIAREMARKLGRGKMSAQAVGQAVGRNPIWIIIPCHRCIGAGGKLTGYAGGLEKKAWLLRHEEGFQ